MQLCLPAPSAKANPASAARACALWPSLTAVKGKHRQQTTQATASYLSSPWKVWKACARLFSSEFCRLKWEKWRAEGIMFFIQRWGETPSWWVINSAKNCCLHTVKNVIPRNCKNISFLFASCIDINCIMYKRMYFSAFIQYSEYTQ